MINNDDATQNDDSPGHEERQEMMQKCIKDESVGNGFNWIIQRLGKCVSKNIMGFSITLSLTQSSLGKALVVKSSGHSSSMSQCLRLNFLSWFHLSVLILFNNPLLYYCHLNFLTFSIYSLRIYYILNCLHW